jgi:exopolysaccharide production protein ExoY
VRLRLLVLQVFRRSEKSTSRHLGAELGLLSLACWGNGDTAMDASMPALDFGTVNAGPHFTRLALYAVGPRLSVGRDHAATQHTKGRIMLRGFDVVLGLIAIVLLAPLMMIISGVIALTDRGPVFFAHKRVGQNGKDFHCLKFRSMRVNADARLRELLDQDPVAREQWQREHKLRNDPRVTFIGRFLRRSSLDELPQLFNVLRGDMSLVGPRPIVQAEIVRYGRYFAYYIAQKPGMTGLWQVSGRNKTTYRRRVAIDTLLLRRMSVRTYFYILVRTFAVIITGHGAY